ncbi:uncharacterized protein BJ171DRAFT_196831 [Polychytrium aggregatum]|uniref:uncharacterized protein n=1 Tax=Polychytrium aggregatum TaxID=110093 RepID=UPI0022FE549F|nr:uncharacterized protein BJ171DRAFT_196831 [Polychytrium aggregatum]KAI9201866.1 hypothetical protein BJ171DRAFT_196831 [Polychytrium aggregatum]
MILNQMQVHGADSPPEDLPLLFNRTDGEAILFYVQAGPRRSKIVAHIEKHGGKVVQASGSEAFCIVVQESALLAKNRSDLSDPAGGPVFLPEQFIYDCVRYGRFLDPEDYARPQLPVSVPIKREKFTPEQDDILLRVLLKNYPNNLGGNKIYKDLAQEQNGIGHTWQAWRQRYAIKFKRMFSDPDNVMRLKHRFPGEFPEVSPSLSRAGAPSTTPTSPRHQMPTEHPPASDTTPQRDDLDVAELYASQESQSGSGAPSQGPSIAPSHQSDRHQSQNEILSQHSVLTSPKAMVTDLPSDSQLTADLEDLFATQGFAANNPDDASSQMQFAEDEAATQAQSSSDHANPSDTAMDHSMDIFDGDVFLTQPAASFTEIVEATLLAYVTAGIQARTELSAGMSEIAPALPADVLGGDRSNDTEPQHGSHRPAGDSTVPDHTHADSASDRTEEDEGQESDDDFVHPCPELGDAILQPNLEGPVMSEPAESDEATDSEQSKNQSGERNEEINCRSERANGHSEGISNHSDETGTLLKRGEVTAIFWEDDTANNHEADLVPRAASPGYGDEPPEDDVSKLAVAAANAVDKHTEIHEDRGPRLASEAAPDPSASQGQTSQPVESVAEAAEPRRPSGPPGPINERSAPATHGRTFDPVVVIDSSADVRVLRKSRQVATGSKNDSRLRSASPVFRRPSLVKTSSASARLSNPQIDHRFPQQAERDRVSAPSAKRKREHSGAHALSPGRFDKRVKAGDAPTGPQRVLNTPSHEEPSGSELLVISDDNEPEERSRARLSAAAMRRREKQAAKSSSMAMDLDSEPYSRAHSDRRLRTPNPPANQRRKAIVSPLGKPIRVTNNAKHDYMQEFKRLEQDFEGQFKYRDIRRACFMASGCLYKARKILEHNFDLAQLDPALRKLIFDESDDQIIRQRQNEQHWNERPVFDAFLSLERRKSEAIVSRRRWWLETMDKAAPGS